MADFDAIVIGSGIAGLTAAASLARAKRRVLLLEQHYRLGGQTQTFRRKQYVFATGLHYLGAVAAGDGNLMGRVLGWVTDGGVRFAPLGDVYDIVHLPDLEFPIEAPAERFRARLHECFPDETAAIDTWFDRMLAGRAAGIRIISTRAMPSAMAALTRWWHRRRIRPAVELTSAEAVAGIRDRRLAAVLSARWGDYGVPPDSAPMAVHGIVLGSFLEGAWYPVGGPARFAECLGAVITDAGGELRPRAPVEHILLGNGRVSGVRLAGGDTVTAAKVVSAMGAHNTLAALPEDAGGAWRRAAAALKPGLSYVTLYLGFRGDIAARGAGTANHWIYETDDVGRVWDRPDAEDAPSLYVTFPSLKDPEHADAGHHTAEVVAICPWEAFSTWSDSERGNRPDAYEAFKARIGERLLAQFARHFPDLAPLVDFLELSTPLTQGDFVRAELGAMYGLTMSRERLAHPVLSVRTPVPGLVLAGQDLSGPGIEAALMSGYLAAATLEPVLWRHMRH